MLTIENQLLSFWTYLQKELTERGPTGVILSLIAGSTVSAEPAAAALQLTD